MVPRTIYNSRHEFHPPSPPVFYFGDAIQFLVVVAVAVAVVILPVMKAIVMVLMTPILMNRIITIHDHALT